MKGPNGILWNKCKLQDAYVKIMDFMMGGSFVASLGSLQRELRSIIHELESIASGISRDFEGIGSEVCARRIRDFIDQCENAQYYLGRVDTSKVREEN